MSCSSLPVLADGRLVDSTLLAGRPMFENSPARGTPLGHAACRRRYGPDALNMKRRYSSRITGGCWWREGGLRSFGATHLRFTMNSCGRLTDQIMPRRFGASTSRATTVRPPAARLLDGPDSPSRGETFLPARVCALVGMANIVRPAGSLATAPEYQTPMVDGMLWVYEGLIPSIWADGAFARAQRSIDAKRNFATEFARIAAAMQSAIVPVSGVRCRNTNGRARAALLYYQSPQLGRAFAAARRISIKNPHCCGLEGWTTLIRRRFQGAQESLDDFLQVVSTAGGSTGPKARAL